MLETTNGSKDKEDDDDAPRYRARGVSATKQEVLAAVQSNDKKHSSAASASLYPRAFCKLLPDVWTNDPTAALVMHADGAGSKAALAYAYWRETGDLSVWKGIAQDALVMNLDDVYCVGATRASGLVTSTIARNRRLVPGEVIKALIEGLEEVMEELRPWGVDLRLAGGETADLGDQVRTLTVDCTLATRMPRADVIDNGNIQAGDWIVGLASWGVPARYETTRLYNSGIGSNGLTAARHDVLAPEVGLRYPETFDPALQELAYCGTRHLTDVVNIEQQQQQQQQQRLTVGQLLLSPTRTYAPVLARLLHPEAGLRKHVHGIVHCSGGGQTKVLRCLDPSRAPLHVVKDGLFDVPAVFRLIAEEQEKHRLAQGGGEKGGSKGKGAWEEGWREMYQVFNMGHRMEVYVGGGEKQALAVVAVAEAMGVGAKVVGRVEEGKAGGNGGRHSLTVHYAGLGGGGKGGEEGGAKFVYT
jgi:phosphoribosylformylglycinamidine cyclo-ligase